VPGPGSLDKVLLKTANLGIPINLITKREPDGRICWSDACPFGIGGYSLLDRAWRIRIPETSPIRGHPGVNNLLEFIGMIVNVWFECLDNPDSQAGILLVECGCCIASQHIRGELNVAADLLSIVGEDDRGKRRPLA
jgi:hypothetical protein